MASSPFGRAKPPSTRWRAIPMPRTAAASIRNFKNSRPERSPAKASTSKASDRLGVFCRGNWVNFRRAGVWFYRRRSFLLARKSEYANAADGRSCARGERTSSYQKPHRRHLSANPNAARTAVPLCKLLQQPNFHGTVVGSAGRRTRLRGVGTGLAGSGRPPPSPAHELQLGDQGPAISSRPSQRSPLRPTSRLVGRSRVAAEAGTISSRGSETSFLPEAAAATPGVPDPSGGRSPPAFLDPPSSRC